jgi:acetoacetyl-CoA reductase/3-oxoacyl-[acyl-carrier protein] reductase
MGPEILFRQAVQEQEYMVDVVIVGASGGIGQYLVSALKDDYCVLATYNTRNPVDYLGVDWWQVDVTQANEVIRFEKEAVFSKQIVLVNLFGVSIDGMCHALPESDWDSVVDTNLKGVFTVCKAFLPRMRRNLWGRIINVSSVVGQMGIPGTSAYSASKSGLFGLTRAIAAENAQKGVTANCLALGYFEVGMINVLSQEVKERVIQSVPMRRLGHPQNIEKAIRFLIEADYVTGATININGGISQ